MTISNKNEANKAAVLAALSAVRSAIQNGPRSDLSERAVEQCQRLERAIEQFHAEGLRFAAFTLLRLVQNSGTTFTDPVHIATRDLKAALDAAGYPH